jgi:hypothetical protein
MLNTGKCFQPFELIEQIEPFELFLTQRPKDTKFLNRTKLLINEKCFQRFEPFELIEPFELLKRLKPLKRFKPAKQFKPYFSSTSF